MKYQLLEHNEMRTIQSLLKTHEKLAFHSFFCSFVFCSLSLQLDGYKNLHAGWNRQVELQKEFK
jgi:hypothetical protein